MQYKNRMVGNMASIDDVEITDELMYTVALAQLYREDAVTAIKKLVPQKLSSEQMSLLHRRILDHPKFDEVKQDAINIECKSLVDDDMNTIMLYYNKLLKQAQYEHKYDIAARILKEIRQIKAIDNEQTKFEISIKVEGMGEKINNTHSSNSSI